MIVPELIIAAVIAIVGIIIIIGTILAVVFAILNLLPFFLSLLEPFAGIYYKIFGKKKESKRSDYSIKMGEEPHKKK